MILRDAIDHYVAWRRAHGAQFITSARALYQFRKGVPEHVCCDAVTERGPQIPRRDWPTHPMACRKVRRSCRILSLCDQPRLCLWVATAGGGRRAEGARICATLHLLP